MDEWTERELLAWTAGFFDGEGSVMIVTMSSGSLRLGVSLGQKVAAPLEVVQARWGGTIRVLAEPRPNRADKVEWRLHGRAAVRFLRDIRPWLIVKASHAEVAFVYEATLSPTHRAWFRVPVDIAEKRLALADRIHELNRRGKVAHG